MNLLRPLAFAALCASALSFSHPASAQEAHAGSKLKRLGVTVVIDEQRSFGPLSVLENVSDDLYAAEFNPPDPLPGWKWPEGEPPLTALRLRLAREGDVVRIKVSAVFDDTWPPEAPGPKYGKREKAVGTYLAREGETVRVGVAAQMDGFAQAAYRGGASPLIESGGTYEMQFGPGRSEPEPSPQPEALFVSTALFADGSYEGDAEMAAKIYARQRGRAMQLARVVLLLRGSLDTDADAPVALAGFKTRVAEMRVDVEPSALDAMLSKFPALRSNDDGRRILAQSAVEGLRNGRDEALRMLEDIERALTQRGERVDLRRMLEELRGEVVRQVGSARD